MKSSWFYTYEKIEGGHVVKKGWRIFESEVGNVAKTLAESLESLGEDCLPIHIWPLETDIPINRDGGE